MSSYRLERIVRHMERFISLYKKVERTDDETDEMCDLMKHRGSVPLEVDVLEEDTPVIIDKLEKLWQTASVEKFN